MEPLLLWKGDTGDAPLGSSYPEGSDANLGTTVPSEQSGHDHDSTVVDGRYGIQIPSVLYGNQYAVLSDTGPTGDGFRRNE